jgi:hypothetical protein
MATVPHSVDASRNNTSSDINVLGARKRKPVQDPLNSEVERLATLAVKKKAQRLELGKSGDALKPARNIPARESSPGVANSDDITRTR